MKTVSGLAAEDRAVLVTNHMTATMLPTLAQYPPTLLAPNIYPVSSLSAIVIVKLSFGICYKIPLFNGGQLNPGIL